MTTKLATPVQASLAAGRYQLTALDGQVDIEDPSVSKAASSLKLGGQVSADLKKETAAADLSALLDQAKMALKAGVNGFKTPIVCSRRPRPMQRLRRLPTRPRAILPRRRWTCRP